MTSNDIVFTGSFSEDTLKLYDRCNNTESMPAQTIHRFSTEYDAFVTKYGPDGRFKWSAQMSGHDLTEGLSCALDPAGHVSVAGFFSDASLNIYNGSKGNTDTPTFATTLVPIDISTNNVFLVKYSNTGAYCWGATVGPNMTSKGRYNLTSVATTLTGETFLATSFQGSNVTLFDGGNNVAKQFNQADASGNLNNVLLAKYRANGSLLWTARIDGVSDNLSRNNLNVDLDGNAYVAMFNYENDKSTFYVYDGDSTPNTYPVVPSTQNDAHSFPNEYVGSSSATIIKFNSSGVYQWNLQIGTSYEVGSVNITTCQDNCFYVTGEFNVSNSTNVQFYDANGVDPSIDIQNIDQLSGTVAGEYKMFVAKYNAEGQVQWANLLTGDISGSPTNSESGTFSYLDGYSVAVDGFGSSYVTGLFFDKLSIRQPFYAGTHNAADSVIYQTVVSNRNMNTGFDSGNNVVVNGFVASFDTLGMFRWVVPLFNYTVIGSSVSVDTNNQIVVGGLFGYYRNSLYVSDALPYKYPLNQTPLTHNSYVIDHVGCGSITGDNHFNYFMLKLNNKGKVLWGAPMGATQLIDREGSVLFFASLPTVTTNNITPKPSNGSC